jgi:hypothetical protein
MSIHVDHEEDRNMTLKNRLPVLKRMLKNKSLQTVFFTLALAGAAALLLPGEPSKAQILRHSGVTFIVEQGHNMSPQLFNGLAAVTPVTFTISGSGDARVYTSAEDAASHATAIEYRVVTLEPGAVALINWATVPAWLEIGAHYAAVDESAVTVTPTAHTSWVPRASDGALPVILNMQDKILTSGIGR